MSFSELTEITKANVQKLIDTRMYDEYKNRCYVDNIMTSFGILSGNPTFRQYELYEACGANHTKKSYSGFVESCALSGRIDMLSIIVNHFHEETPSNRLSVAVLAIAICACKGNISVAEKSALERIVKF